MAHTDRDYNQWFWKNHYSRRGPCSLYTERGGYGYIRGTCWCDSIINGWTKPYKFEQGKPSWWNRNCRREERAKIRNLMDRARRGHIDWDELAINYRRPYYW